MYTVEYIQKHTGHLKQVDKADYSSAYKFAIGIIHSHECNVTIRGRNDFVKVILKEEVLAA